MPVQFHGASGHGPSSAEPEPLGHIVDGEEQHDGGADPEQHVDRETGADRPVGVAVAEVDGRETDDGEHARLEDPADVIGIPAPIWHEKAPTARKLRQRIRAVLEWAVAMEFRTDNPCDRVGSVLGTQDAVVRHMRALPHREVASTLRKLRASNAMPVARLAFEFLVLTAARWGEVRWAEWSEIDQTEGMWTVPETRMKAKREHRVPLYRRAKEILAEARTLDDGATRLVFTREGGKPLVDRQLRQLLHRNEIAAVPHGFRSSFRDWAAEETDHPREVVEAALAHVAKNKVEAAYRRTDLFERQRRLMEDWAIYLAGESRQLASGRLR